MFQKPDVRSPDHWRSRAEEARALADGLTTEANREQMLRVAESYDDRAAQAEREQERADEGDTNDDERAAPASRMARDESALF